MDSFILNEHDSRSSTLPSNNLLLQLLFLNRLLFYLFFIATRDSIFEYSFTFNNINFERCSNTHTQNTSKFFVMFSIQWKLRISSRVIGNRGGGRGEDTPLFYYLYRRLRKKQERERASEREKEIDKEREREGKEEKTNVREGRRGRRDKRATT